MMVKVEDIQPFARTIVLTNCATQPADLTARSQQNTHGLYVQR